MAHVEARRESAHIRRESGHTGTTGEAWRNTILAGLANYIDAGRHLPRPSAKRCA